jgi:hypothetical protein
MLGKLVSGNIRPFRTKSGLGMVIGRKSSRSVSENSFCKSYAVASRSLIPYILWFHSRKL